jgi:adenylyl cyclase-associated protein
VEKMFANQRTLLLTAAACQKPSEKELGDLLKPLTEDLAAISKAKETYRKEREWQSHLTFIAEGASAVGWVSLVRVPISHCSR